MAFSELRLNWKRYIVKNTDGTTGMYATRCITTDTQKCFPWTPVHKLIYSKKAIGSKQCSFWSWLNTEGNIDLCEYKQIRATKHIVFSICCAEKWAVGTRMFSYADVCLLWKGKACTWVFKSKGYTTYPMPSWKRRVRLENLLWLGSLQ